MNMLLFVLVTSRTSGVALIIMCLGIKSFAFIPVLGILSFLNWGGFRKKKYVFEAKSLQVALSLPELTKLTRLATDSETHLLSQCSD